MPYIKLGMLTDFEIPLPPLSVQLDIVARLDSTMTEIDSLREETESALTSTRELWESTLESVFASGRKDWEEKKL
jgi:type I restriction enzyme, S subunit